MRKNLFLLAFCMAGFLPASAKPALFTSPTETKTRENVTCAAGSLVGDYGSLYSRQQIYSISSFRKSNVATTAVAITVDLSAAAKVTGSTRLLTFDSTHELGLMVTPEGITGNWHGSPWGEFTPLGSLATHPAAIHRDGTTYLTLTIVASGCSGAGWNGIGGIMGYNVNGDLMINLPRLASAENKDFTAIHANPDLVKFISIDPDVSCSHSRVPAQAAEQALKTQNKFLKSRGEWLTPTQWTSVGILGLLIIGAISIFCLRKGKW